MSTDIPTDSVDRRSFNSNNMSTEYRSSLGRYVGRVSVDISADCRSTYRPRVSTDTRSTDALSTHDPIFFLKVLIIRLFTTNPLMPDSFKIFSIISVMADSPAFLSPLKWYELNSCENK